MQKWSEVFKALKDTKPLKPYNLKPVLEKISSSSLDNFKNCRRKAFFHTVLRITLKRAKRELEKGTIWHTTLEALYRKGGEQAIRGLNKFYKEMVNRTAILDMSTDDIALERAIILGMFRGFEFVFGITDRKVFKFLELEKEFNIPNFKETGVTLTGRMDGILEIAKGAFRGVWTHEIKTAKDLKYYRPELIKLNGQGLCYCSAAKTLGYDPKGTVWSIIRKPSIRLKIGQTVEEFCDELIEDYSARPDFYFIREYSTISDIRIKEWENETQKTILDLLACFKELPNLAIWYKNTQQCNAYGGCEFLPLCSKGMNPGTLSLYKTIELPKGV